MLEVVCIKISTVYNFVWLYIIIKYRYLKVVSSSSRIGFAASRISECGVSDAATVMVLSSSAAKTTDVPTVPSTNAPVSAAAINFS